MILYLIFAVVLALVIIVSAALKSRANVASRKLVTIGVVLFLVGGIMGVFMTTNLVEETAKTNWPFVSGIVTSSKVIGERAFRPEIKYDYSVGGVKYSGISGLDDPGFGGRTKRLDTAEKMITEYPVGEEVPVYFNPDDPAESLLVHHVAWSTYMQLTLAVTIALAGAVILIFFAYKPQSEYAASDRVGVPAQQSQ